MNTFVVGFIAFVMGILLMASSPFLFNGVLLTGGIDMIIGWVLMVQGIANLGAGVESP